MHNAPLLGRVIIANAGETTIPRVYRGWPLWGWLANFAGLAVLYAAVMAWAGVG